MEEDQRRGLETLLRIGYLPILTGLVQTHCAPFVWSARGKSGLHEILHNGTVTFVDTGSRLIAVTANHVYQQYLLDKGSVEPSDFGCQFGGSSFEPEKRLISSDADIDIATFDFPEVLVPHARVIPHAAANWPAPPALDRQVIIVGGFPGKLRSLEVAVLEQPFQHFIGAITSASDRQIVLHLDYKNLVWPEHDGEPINQVIGGMSGGPVFRIVEKEPIDRLELVGFIREGSQDFELIFAVPASVITFTGEIVGNT